MIVIMMISQSFNKKTIEFRTLLISNPFPDQAKNIFETNRDKKNKAKERCSVMAKTVNGHTVILWGSTSCSRDRGQSQITH